MLEYPKYHITATVLSADGISTEGKFITNDDPSFKFWYPVLFGFHDVLMNSDDLEVRTR